MAQLPGKLAVCDLDPFLNLEKHAGGGYSTAK